MRIDTFSLKNGIEELKGTHQENKEYCKALHDVERIISDIEEDISDKNAKFVLDRLGAMPDIPNERKYWGKTYQSQCVCGGIITAMRSTYNGHMRAMCDKCQWSIIE